MIKGMSLRGALFFVIVGGAIFVVMRVLAWHESLLNSLLAVLMYLLGAATATVVLRKRDRKSER